jgi:hypothetical protein
MPDHFLVSYRSPIRLIIFHFLPPAIPQNPSLTKKPLLVKLLRAKAFKILLGTYFFCGKRTTSLKSFSRHGAEATMKPRKFALIVTISDPTRVAHVYDEMSVNILNRFQVQNLALRTSTRVQTWDSQ